MLIMGKLLPLLSSTCYCSRPKVGDRKMVRRIIAFIEGIGLIDERVGYKKNMKEVNNNLTK